MKARRPRAGSSRSRKRSTPPHCAERTRGTPHTAAPPASCCAPAPASGRCTRCDHVGDRECLARAGDPEQRLVRQPVVQTFDQLGDGLRLIARRLDSRACSSNSGCLLHDLSDRLGGFDGSAKSRLDYRAAIPSSAAGHSSECTSLATRSARQALAHARRHRARRATQGRRQGHHRPRRRRAGFRHAGAHRGGRRRGDPQAASRATRTSTASTSSRTRSSRSSSATTASSYDARADPGVDRRQADYLQPLHGRAGPG